MGGWKVERHTWISTEVDTDSCSGEWEDGHRTCWIGDRDGPIACVVAPMSADNDDILRRAALVAAAPDHALLLAAIVSGRARVEPLGASVEVCTGGLRYATKLGENGCPLVSDVIRTALLSATVQR